MKSFVLKLTLIGLLGAGFLAFCPQGLSLVHQGSPSAEVPQPKPVLPPPGVKHLEKVEDLVIELTNEARRSKGLAPLIKDNELRDVARAYSNDMLVRQFFDHTTPDGVSFDKRITGQYHHRVYVVGENIWFASGYNPANIRRLAKEIVDDWLDSRDHRENLLAPDFTHLGVGVSARHHSIRATQEFVGKPKSFIFEGIIQTQGP